MKIATLKDLFLHELKDLYDAERQLLDALPMLVKTSNAPDLAAAFENHLEETRGHVRRLQTVFEAYGEEPERESCKAMKGLIAEAERMIAEVSPPDVRDAGLISAAQRIEHYEIAAYGTLLVWARTIGLIGVEEPLATTLFEEKTADERLTEIAEASVNSAAAR